MLTSKRVACGTLVNARDEQKKAGPWACPACSAVVILKKGEKKVHHFAHTPPVTCEYGSGESELHRRCKLEIFDRLAKHPNVTDLQLELGIGPIRPDIFFRYKGQAIGIEVQASALSTETIAYRTRSYAALGIQVLWLGVWSDALDTDKYAPRIWEKWLHAAYFGRVYYWRSGLGVVAVHYNDHMLWATESEWYNSAGEIETAGGYHYRSKRWRTPCRLEKPVDILLGMREVKRPEWSGDGVSVPRSLLRIDVAPHWWGPSK
jgi:competence protein CoiA